MIVIRGIKGETYARKINKGIVDCRDLLSALLVPPVTGYEFSDYYEKNLVKALTYFSNQKDVDINNPRFLHSLLVDPFVPHIYLTYFHVLSENSLKWLENFDDDYSFIAVNINLDRITKTAIGSEYFGARMTYVDSIRELEQDTFQNFYAASMCSMENLFENKRDMGLLLQIYNTLFFPLLCREQDGKFTDIENEFRIIAYDCPKMVSGIIKQVPREAVITTNGGEKYEGIIHSCENAVFKNTNKILRNPYKPLRDILHEEKGKIMLDSKFKSIDIRQISNDYGYLGNKTECADFIKYTLKNYPREVYVDRTIRKEYKIGELKNVAYAPSHQEVEY